MDLGANVDCQPEHLLQFAVMGAALVSALQPGGPEPSVGLLNIGEEAIKGNEAIKRTGELLRSAGQAGALNFYGNVEGNDIFKGTVRYRGLRRFCRQRGARRPARAWRA